MPEHDCKPWFASRTIWGALTIMIIAFALLALGVVALAKGADPALALTAIIAALVQLPAGLLTIIGRVDATQRIERRSVVPDGDVPRTLAWAALACLLFLPLMGCVGRGMLGDQQRLSQSDDRGTDGYTQGIQFNNYDFSGVPKAFQLGFNAKADPYINSRPAEAKLVRDKDGNPLLVDDEPVYELSASESTSIEGEPPTAKQIAVPSFSVVIIGNPRQWLDGQSSAASTSGEQGSRSDQQKPISVPVQYGAGGSQGDTSAGTTPASN